MELRLYISYLFTQYMQNFYSGTYVCILVTISPAQRYAIIYFMNITPQGWIMESLTYRNSFTISRLF